MLSGIISNPPHLPSRCSPSAAWPERMDELEPGKTPDTIGSVTIGWATSNTYAGSDTTAISLRALFYHLPKNPNSMARPPHEINTSEGLPNPVSWADAKQMSYLGICVKETLRINPAPTMLLERIAPKGG